MVVLGGAANASPIYRRAGVPPPRTWECEAWSGSTVRISAGSLWRRTYVRGEGWAGVGQKKGPPGEKPGGPEGGRESVEVTRFTLGRSLSRYYSYLQSRKFSAYSLDLFDLHHEHTQMRPMVKPVERWIRRGSMPRLGVHVGRPTRGPAGAQAYRLGSFARDRRWERARRGHTPAPPVRSRRSRRSPG